MSPDYAAGQRLGDYEVITVLGAGGMGKVYKVRNVISDRIEAMKIILPNLANQKELADRFLREIKLLGSLDHPNIAALRTALTLDNQLVMIMEYVEGVTLGSRLQQGPLPPMDAVNYADQILSALSYAHKLNVIHRDIKPANMMLTPQGVVKLMDFGLARPGEQTMAMTVTSTTLGSVNYMPPEQVKGETVDARSDLYSLGVSLYEMVTGQLPFQGESGYSLMTAHVQELPRAPVAIRPSLPKGLSDIILIALSKDPAKRFQSADAFRNALKSVFSSASIPPASTAARGLGTQPAVSQDTLAPLQKEPAVAAGSLPSIKPTASEPPNSNRGFYVALGALLVVLVLFAAGFYLPRRIKTHASAHSDTSASAPSAASQLGSASTPSATTSPSARPEGTTPSPDRADGASAVKTSSSENSDTRLDLKESAVPPAAKPPVRTSSGPSPTALPAAPASKKPFAAATQPTTLPGGPQQANAPATADETAAAAVAATALEQAQHQADQLVSRASAVSQSLDQLRRQQSAQGYGLRGDVVASEQRMLANVSAAQSALQQRDTAKAKGYLDLAEVEVEKLEKFLGR